MILEQEHDLKIHIIVFQKRKEILDHSLRPEVLVLLVSSYNVTSINYWSVILFQIGKPDLEEIKKSTLVSVDKHSWTQHPWKNKKRNEKSKKYGKPPN